MSEPSKITNLSRLEQATREAYRKDTDEPTTRTYRVDTDEAIWEVTGTVIEVDQTGVLRIVDETVGSFYVAAAFRPGAWNFVYDKDHIDTGDDDTPGFLK